MDVLLLNSITDAGAAAAGRIVASGSHGGLYPAAVASGAGVRAVAFNDAGTGLQQAGIAGVMALQDVGMAAIAADCVTCHIGDAGDLARNGVVSATNRIAQDIGIAPGMTMAAALQLLATAPVPHGRLPPVAEARQSRALPDGPTVALLDSASLVGPDDTGAIVITGSHGGLIGGNPARALKAAARIAIFNDAGVGKDAIGITRLPALQARGIAAATVAASSARIGDAASALATGILSHVNDSAAGLGAKPGMALAAWLSALPSS